MMPIADSGPVNKKVIKPDLFENKTKIHRKKQMRYSVKHLYLVHFTVAKPLNRSEAKVDLVMM